MQNSNLNILQSQPNFNWRNHYRYTVYEHQLLADNKSSYSRSFIVLKNQYDVIVYFTSFHSYIDSYEQGVCVPLASDVKAKLHYICAMLNYIVIDNYEKFRVNHVFNIEKEMLENFFEYYALPKKVGGNCKSKQTILKCVSAVTEFFRKLSQKYGGYMKISATDLYHEKTAFSKRGKVKKILAPNFKVRGAFSNKRIFRDIPTKIFEIIVNQAFRHTPEIAFAICLQSFAGLRPGEICNVRQEASPLGSGISLTSINGVIKKAEIDLSTEYILRSDGVRCGGIKTKRIQRVHPSFLSAFCQAYEFHKEHYHTNFESEYCPMFAGARGKAMTYFDYRGRFQYLICTYVRPYLLSHEDPNCRLYGQMLYENSLAPHAVRHWFSVQLVLMGEDIAGLQYWRGDSNPTSAFVYLQNKGDLVNALSKTNEQFADFLITEGVRLYGKKE